MSLPKTVLDMLPAWLTAAGYDGLTDGESCACVIDNLAPCGERCDVCRPGYRVPCPGEECEFHRRGCEFHIVTEKPEVPQ